MSRNEIFLDASGSCVILWKVKKKGLKAFSAHRTWVCTVCSGAGHGPRADQEGCAVSPQLCTHNTGGRCTNLAVVFMTPGVS